MSYAIDASRPAQRPGHPAWHDSGARAGSLATQEPDLRPLMVGYREGRAGAFDELYARLAPVVRKRLASLAADAAWVDDLLQESFLQIHRARHTYRSDLPVQPWALAIARHVFLMACRARRRRVPIHLASPDGLDRLGRPDHASPCAAARDVDRYLALLTPGTRRAVVLHHLYGLSLEDTGRCLGIRATAAKLRVSRGLAVIRRRVDRPPKP